MDIKKRGFDLKSKIFNKNSIIIASLAIIVIIIAAYFLFFNVKKCSDIQCFQKSLQECSKATYTNDGESAVWLYKIKSSSKNECIVNVKAIEIKGDVSASFSLKGKDMDCYIPEEISGAFMPENKIEYCHGLLKEAMQDMMMKKMQLYIIQNLEKIK